MRQYTSDKCPCDLPKEDCTHPDCGNAERLVEGIKILVGVSHKICPACNQKICTCNDTCESCGA
jgi:hypothetical protein